MQHTELASFRYQFLQNLIFQKKSIENLFWHFYKLFQATKETFHARHSFLHAIRN